MTIETQTQIAILRKMQATNLTLLDNLQRISIFWPNCHKLIKVMGQPKERRANNSR
jgi:hypothetical protein